MHTVIVVSFSLLAISDLLVLACLRHSRQRHQRDSRINRALKSAVYTVSRPAALAV